MRKHSYLFGLILTIFLTIAGILPILDAQLKIYLRNPTDQFDKSRLMGIECKRACCFSGLPS